MISIRNICLLALLMASTGLNLNAQDNKSAASRAQWMSELQQYKRSYFIKELDLTREQQNEFFPLYEEMDAQTSQIDSDLRTMERRLQDATDVTETEYRKAAEAFCDGKVRQAEIEKSYMDRFARVLTAKQLFRLNAVERDFQRDILKQHQRLRLRRAAAETSRQ